MGSMEKFNEDHELCNRYHESVDERRDISSVSSFTSTSDVRADNVVLCSAPIHGLAASSQAIDEMYSRFGPTPRICFELSKMQSLLNWHRRRSEIAIAKLSSRTLREMVNGALELNFDDVSHTIVLVKRRGNDLSQSLIIVEPITLVVEMALRNQLRRETQAERLALYRSLANVEDSRRLAGVVYESLAQEKLQQQNPIELHLFPMIKKRPQGSGKGKKLPRWYSNHGDGVDPSSVQSINIRRTDNDVFSSMPDPIKDNIYYVPESPNQVAFDSFIMDDKKLFIFQFTIASFHEIKTGILTSFSQDSLPPKKDWYFVFAVPPTLSEISCPEKGFLEGVKLYSAVVDPEL